MMRTLWGGALAAIMIASGAQAQTDAQDGVDWYVRLAAGVGGPDDVDVSTAGGGGRRDGDDVLVGGRVSAAIGVQPLSFLRAELEFTSSGNEFDSDLSDAYGQGGILLNVIAEAPLGDAWGVFAGVGAGFGATGVDFDDGLDSESEDDDISQAFVGVSYDFSERFTLDGMMRSIRYPDLDEGGLVLRDADSIDLMVGLRFYPGR